MVQGQQNGPLSYVAYIQQIIITDLLLKDIHVTRSLFCTAQHIIHIIIVPIF